MLVIPVCSSARSPRADTRVKRSALAVFRAVRRVAAGAARVPGNVRDLGRDVADAWRESAKP